MRKTLVVVVGLFVIAPLLAAETPRQAFEGAYVLNAGRSDDIEAAIDAVVEEMAWLKRGFARRRLREVNEPYRRVIISLKEDRVGIAADGRGFLWTDDAGTPRKWTSPEGDRVTVSTTWQNGHLRRTFAGEGGTRVNTYVLDPGQRVLRMHVRIVSPQLPGPLTYTLVYRLASDEPRA